MSGGHGEFWISLAFEVLVPLIMTSMLFWTVIMPQAEKHVQELAASIAGQIQLPTCDPTLQAMLPNLRDLRERLAALPTPLMRNYVVAVNAVVVIIVALVAVVLPLAFRVSPRTALALLIEVLLLYAVIIVAEIFFITQIAFNYVPGSPQAIITEALARVAYACFDAPLYCDATTDMGRLLLQKPT